MTLRPDQQRWLRDIDRAWQSHRVVCAQAPTGAGKTFSVAHLLREHTGRAVFFARLDAILSDTLERLGRHGVDAGIVQADRPTRPDAPVQVCSIATVTARGVAPDADLVILDECHCVMGPTVRAIVDAYPSARILGITATPQRSDGQPLDDVFETLVSGPSFSELCAVGAIVPARIIGPSRYLDGALYRRPSDVLSPGCRALVFCSSIAHADETVADLRIHGVAARLITGETPRREREDIRAALRSGECHAIVGVDVFREGFDEPTADVLVLARSFEFVGAWLQVLGRGVRSAPGKTHCTVHDLAGSYHLLGAPDEPRVWSITGDACVRTRAGASLYRCRQCGALWPSARDCDNCGAAHRTHERLPRVLRRAEEAYLFEHDPQHRAKRIAAFDPQRYETAVYERIRRTGKPDFVARKIAQNAVRTKRRKLGLLDTNGVPCP